MTSFKHHWWIVSQTKAPPITSLRRHEVCGFEIVNRNCGLHQSNWPKCHRGDAESSGGRMDAGSSAVRGSSWGHQPTDARLSMEARCVRWPRWASSSWCGLGAQVLSDARFSLCASMRWAFKSPLWEPVAFLFLSFFLSFFSILLYESVVEFMLNRKKSLHFNLI